MGAIELFYEVPRHGATSFRLVSNQDRGAYHWTGLDPKAAAGPQWTQVLKGATVAHIPMIGFGTWFLARMAFDQLRTHNSDVGTYLVCLQYETHQMGVLWYENAGSGPVGMGMFLKTHPDYFSPGPKPKEDPKAQLCAGSGPLKFPKPKPKTAWDFLDKLED